MNKEEAIKLCERYKVNLALYPNTIVTANGNIYTSGKVDPKDTSEQIKCSVEKEIENCSTFSPRIRDD